MNVPEAAPLVNPPDGDAMLAQDQTGKDFRGSQRVRKAGDTVGSDDYTTTVLTPNGSLQTRANAGQARRFDKRSNTWQDLDFTVATRADKRLAPKVPLTDVSVAPTADALNVLSVATPVGDFSIAHSGARAARARVVDGNIVFDNAFTGGAQLVETPGLYGAEETVVVQTKSGGNGYDATITTPAGITARQGAHGIEFVDSSFTVVFQYDNGAAYDAKGAGAPVTVTLTSIAPQSARVHVEVSRAWFDASTRAFPVAIDPDFNWVQTPGPNATGDTTISTDFPTTNQWSDPQLRVGTFNGGASVYRSEIKFPFTFPYVNLENNPKVRIDNATMRLWTEQSGSACWTNNDTKLNAIELTQYKGLFTTFANPSPYNTTGVSANFSYGNGCPEQYAAVDVTGIMQQWSAGALPNNGLLLAADNERANVGWKKFTSSEGRSDHQPQLSIDFDYYDANYGAGRQWNRLAGSESHIPMLVQNKGLTPWTADRYALRMYAKVGNALQWIGTGKIPAGVTVAPNAYYQFDVTVQSLPIGTYNATSTMTDLKYDTTGIGLDGDFDWHGVGNRGDTLVVTNEAGLGEPAYSSLDGGLVNTLTGNLHYETTDFDIPSVGPGLKLDRSFNSMDATNGWFGTGWTSSYEMHVESDPNGAVLVHPDGRKEFYSKTPTGKYQPPPGYVGDFFPYGDKYVLQDANKTQFVFAQPSATQPGALLWIVNEQQQKLSITNGWNNRPKTIKNDVTGRTLTFTWSSGGHVVTQVTTNELVKGNASSALSWAYTYNGYKLLSACLTTANGPLCTNYDPSNTPMTWLQQPSGARLFTVAYDPEKAGRVANRFDALNNHTTYTYKLDGDGLLAQYKTTVVDPKQHASVYHFNFDMQTVSIQDPVGNLKHFMYDTEVKENLSARGLLYQTEYVDGAGKSLGTTTTKWDDDANARVRVDAVGGKSYMDYDKGHMTLQTYPLVTSQKDTSYGTTFKYNADGTISTKTTPAVNGGTKTHTWLYSAGNEPAHGSSGTEPKGLPNVETDENGNRTVSYYDSAGDLTEVRKPSGLVVTYQYDALGRRTNETDTCTNCPNAGANVTVTTYDELSRPLTVTEPRFDDSSADGEAHQKQTRTSYWPDGQVKEVDVIDLAGSDVTRVTRHDYNAAGNETHTFDSEHGDTYKTYDTAGNVTTTTDANGTVTRTDYDAANRPIAVTMLGYQDDPGGEPGSPSTQPRDLAIASNITYDAMGNRTGMTDALGHRVSYAFDAAGRPTITKILNFDGAGHDFVVSDIRARDGAGNPTQEVTNNGQLTVNKSYDKLGRLIQTVEDPNGAMRETDLTLDGNGNVLTKVVRLGVKSGKNTNPALAQIDDKYDSLDHVLTETVHNGSTSLVTTNTYDKRGNKVTTTDPNNKVTSYTYDAADHVIAVSAPPVKYATTNDAQTLQESAAKSAVTRTAYDTFGEIVRSKDANGNLTATAYDMTTHTKTVAYPKYTPLVAGIAAVTPTETWRTDPNGNVIAHIDRSGNETDYGYTKLNKVFAQIDPPSGLGAPRGVLHTIYDPVGNKIQTIDQENRSTQWRYDAAGRVTQMFVDHYANGAWTSLPPTTYTYDGGGRVLSTTTPSGDTSSQTYNALGALLTATVPLENGQYATTTHTPDFFGHDVAVTEPGGRTTKNVYDPAGRQLSTTQYASTVSTTPVTQSVFTYDNNGNRLTSQSLSGVKGKYQTSYTYDDANRLTSVTQPLDATTSAKTTYQYDLVGNLTDQKVPRTSTITEDTIAHYNSWNLRDAVVEPSTPGHTAIDDRRYETAYDAAGHATYESQPGGVVTVHGLDGLGRETVTLGVTQSAFSVKQYAYDRTNKVTQATSSGPGYGTSIAMSYDDRSLLRDVGGSGGSTTFDYDTSGRLSSRVDASGTATFAWTKQSQLKSLSDPLTGSTITETYDNDGRLSASTLPSGAQHTYTYDGAGRLQLDTLKKAGGNTTMSTAWTFDDDGNLAKQVVTGTNVAGVGTNTYTYDRADRVKSWTAPNNQTTTYSWDLAGNRTSAGNVTYTYNDRNQIVGDSNSKTYTWSANGWLTNDAGSAITYDAFGRPTSSGGVTYTYDAYDRVATRNGTSFTYAGLDSNPISDGTFKATHDPAGNPISYLDNTGAHLTATNIHTDVTALTNLDGTVASSTSYDPFGSTIATTGTKPTLGYQSNYSDPTTNQSKMGARWYDPALGQFTSRDTYDGKTQQPVTLNRYTYGNDNPLTQVDPTGHSSYGGVSSSYFMYQLSEIVLYLTVQAHRDWFPHYQMPDWMRWNLAASGLNPDTYGSDWLKGHKTDKTYYEQRSVQLKNDLSKATSVAPVTQPKFAVRVAYLTENNRVSFGLVLTDNADDIKSLADASGQLCDHASVYGFAEGAQKSMCKPLKKLRDFFDGKHHKSWLSSFVGDIQGISRGLSRFLPPNLLGVSSPGGLLAEELYLVGGGSLKDQAAATLKGFVKPFDDCFNKSGGTMVLGCAEVALFALTPESATNEAIPSVIYREGTPRLGNLTPRAVDEGALSFRDSLSNPISSGARPVFRPGEPYIAIDTSKLPPGSVVVDNLPPGHVSVVGVSPEDLRQAVIDRGKFPK